MDNYHVTKSTGEVLLSQNKTSWVAEQVNSSISSRPFRDT